MTRVTLLWEDGAESLPKHHYLLEAVPGVGNVGKLVLDTLVNTHPSRTVLRILHPDLPPHATLDDDGLLEPPCMTISAVDLPSRETILVLTANFQPLSPAGQYEVATAVLDLCSEGETGLLLILAGLAAEVEQEAVHLVCASADDKEAMEARGLEVGGEHPSAGIIGLTGLLASLAPISGVPSACVVAETAGTSVDIIGADRLAKWIEDSFELQLGLELDSTETTAEKLREFFELDEIAEIDLGLGKGAEGDSEAFYA